MKTLIKLAAGPPVGTPMNPRRSTGKRFDAKAFKKDQLRKKFMPSSMLMRDALKSPDHRVPKFSKNAEFMRPEEIKARGRRIANKDVRYMDKEWIILGQKTNPSQVKYVDDSFWLMPPKLKK